MLIAGLTIFPISATATSGIPDTLERRAAGRIGFDVRPAFMLPTDEFFKGDNSTGSPIRSECSFHLEYSFRFGKDSYLGRLYPDAYQGIGTSLDRFQDSKEIGTPAAVYLFQGAPLARLSPRLTFGYEWNFGVSFGWKEYDEATNNYNKVVGSDINAYINIGFTMTWNVSRNWNLLAAVDLTHYSNGNTAYPNGGVNLAGARIGVARSFSQSLGSHSSNARTEASSSFKPHLGMDIVAYGSTRIKGVIWSDAARLVPGSFGIAGINLSPMWSFSKYFKSGISVDAQYDESANIKDYFEGNDHNGELRFYRPPFREQFAVGVSARVEMTMPLFSVNIGIGRNLICKGVDTDVSYQIVALKVAVTRHSFIHIGYQLSDFRNPNNLMLGVGWRIR